MEKNQSLLEFFVAQGGDVSVCVEVIPGQVGKVHNVSIRDGSFVSFK